MPYGMFVTPTADAGAAVHNRTIRNLRPSVLLKAVLNIGVCKVSSLYRILIVDNMSFLDNSLELF